MAAQVAELERLGRLRRFLSPQIAQLVVDTRGRVVPAQPPPRDRLGVHRPAGVHAVRRERRAGGDHGGAGGVPPGARRARLRLRGDPRALRRRRAARLLQRPGPVPGRTGPRRADGRGHARPGRRAGAGRGAARGTTSASGWASPRATPRWAGSGSPAATTTPRSARSPTSRPGCAPGAGPDQILVSQRVRHGIVGRGRTAGRWGHWSSRASAGPWRRTRSSRCTRTEVASMSDVAESTGRRSTSSTRTAATRSSTRLQARMPEVWTAMRRDDPRESVVVVPSMTLDRVVQQLRRDEPGARGALPVLPPPAAPATAADGLRDLAADQPAHRRLLPLAAAGRHPEPRAVPALPRLRRRLAAPSRSSRRCSRAPGSSPGSASSIPDRSLSHLVPYNTTTLERDLAVLLGIPMYGADPRLFPLGTKTGCRRLFARAGVRYPPGVEDLHSRDDLEEALVALRAAAARTSGRRWSSSTRGSPARATRSSTSPDLPAPGSPQERGGGGGRGSTAWSWRTPGIEVDAYLAKLERARRHRRGAGRRRRAAQPERADAGDAAGRGRGALDPRPGARRAERAVLPRLPVPRRPGVRRG